MGRPRNGPDSPGLPVRGETIDFFELISRLPPGSRLHLLIEEKERLEQALARVTELLEGVPVGPA